MECKFQVWRERLQLRNIAICETQAYLTATLEREFVATPEISFRWFPYAEDFFRQVGNSGYDIAIVACEKISQEQMLVLRRITSSTTVLAIIPNDDFEFECLLREIGCVSVLVKSTGFPKIIDVFRQLLQSVEQPLPVRT